MGGAAAAAIALTSAPAQSAKSWTPCGVLGIDPRPPSVVLASWR